MPVPAAPAIEILEGIRSALGLWHEGHARRNLLVALVDIQRAEGHADEISCRAIRRVVGQLGEVERLLAERVVS